MFHCSRMWRRFSTHLQHMLLGQCYRMLPTPRTALQEQSNRQIQMWPSSFIILMVFVSLGALCPISHPHAYNGGMGCCSSPWRELVPGNTTCDGDILQEADTCCPSGKASHVMPTPLTHAKVTHSMVGIKKWQYLTFRSCKCIHFRLCLPSNTPIPLSEWSQVLQDNLEANIRQWEWLWWQKAHKRQHVLSSRWWYGWLQWGFQGMLKFV